MGICSSPQTPLMVVFVFCAFQSHTLDVEQLTGALHKETQGKHRLSSSFKTLKELNDNLKYQVGKALMVHCEFDLQH